MLEVLIVKITHQNKRKDTAGTKNSCVVPQTWTVEVKATYLMTLYTATFTQNKIRIWAIGGKQLENLSTWRKTCPRPRIPYGLAGSRTRASAMKDRRLTRLMGLMLAEKSTNRGTMKAN